MEEITYENLRVNLDFIQNLETMQILERYNHHAEFRLTAWVKEEAKDECIDWIEEDRQIMASAAIEGEDVVLFYGVVTKMKILVESELCKLELEGVSSTIRMDREKRSRSFQDKKQTYRDVIQEVLSAYGHVDSMDILTKGEMLDTLVIQYEETDWTFLQRLSSHFGGGVCPCPYHEDLKLVFGIPMGEELGILQNYNNTVFKNLEAYLQLKGSGVEGIRSDDFIEYRIDTTEVYSLGAKAVYQDIPVMIREKKALLSEGVLRFHYILCPEKGFTTTRRYPEALAGCSMEGIVLKRIQDRIKVKLSIDEKQDYNKAWEFPVSSGYTAKNQAGWYCMPEEGDTAVIYFPNRNAADGFGRTCIRKGEEERIQDPAIKYFRTADGKEIKFAPDEVVITCINGIDPDSGEHKVIYIRLSQKKGIEIVSTEPILMKSEKGITMVAKEAIQILAEEEIILKCKNSQITMDGKIEIAGPDVRIN